MRLLLCTDLDRTLLPNGSQQESERARETFSLLVSRPQVTLVYVTGRDKSLVQQAIADFHIPQPDFVIADVGSTIYKIKNNSWQHWPSWDKEIADDWQGKSHDEIHALLAGFEDLQLQEQDRQKTHKLSYYLPLQINPAVLIENIQQQLQKHQILANLVWSIDEQAGNGLLDILPASASKRHAIEFLMQQLQYDLKETVFAGDSGNDLSVLVSPIQSVLVANASDDVKVKAREEAEINKQQETLYVASGDCCGMNGNYSAGIIEGVLHYMPQMKILIERDEENDE